MTPEEAAVRNIVYQLLPSRYGMNPDDLRGCDRSRLRQGAKPGGGGDAARPENQQTRSTNAHVAC